MGAFRRIHNGSAGGQSKDNWLKKENKRDRHNRRGRGWCSTELRIETGKAMYVLKTTLDKESV